MSEKELKGILIQDVTPTPDNPVEIKKLIVNKEAENYIEDLQQKVEQLEERCEYLERSNNRREDEIMELRDENVDLVSKNEQLENIRTKVIDYITTEQLYTNYQWGKSQYVKILKDLLNILNKGSEE